MAAALFAVAIKRKDKRLMSLLLCGTLTVSAAAVTVRPANAADTDNLLSFSDEYVLTLNGEEVTVTLTVEYPAQADIHDNSVEDMAKLNNGVAPEIIYKNNGRLSFLDGRYTDYKVINEDTALSSTDALLTLLDVADKDITADLVSIRTNDNGDTYYKFNQMYGATWIDGASFIVGADKDGNVISFTSSIQPDKGITDEIDIMDVNQIIENYKKTLSEGVEFTVVSDPELVVYRLYGSPKYCWKVMTLNNDSESNIHYTVYYFNASSGKLEGSAQRNALSDDASGYDQDIYFKGIATTDIEFTDYFGEKVTLPVAETTDSNGEKTYYLLDTERKIIGADYKALDKIEIVTDAKPTPYTFKSVQDLSPIYVSAFHNIQTVYDYYKNEKGLVGIDGKGTPIQALFDIGQENAFCAGNINGFTTFIYGKYPIAAPLDITAHEFTHGVKSQLSGQAGYMNTTGSIEEAYADILGNMIEMIVDPEHSDTETWQIGERTKAIRSMGNPHEFMQPEYIGDVYYQMDVDANIAGDVNDRGGVHSNNSILSQVSYKMNKELGIDLTDDIEIWYDTLYVFNSNAGYDDVRGYLKHAMRRNGFDNKTDAVENIFKNANAIDADQFSWENAEIPENATMIQFQPTDSTANQQQSFYWLPIFMDNEKNTFGSMLSDGSAVIVVEDKEVSDDSYISKLNCNIAYGTEYLGAVPLNDERFHIKTERNGNVITVSFDLSVFKDLKK